MKPFTKAERKEARRMFELLHKDICAISGFIYADWDRSLERTQNQWFVVARFHLAELKKARAK